MVIQIRHIELSRGLFATIDEEDFEEVSKYEWHVIKAKYTYYAVRSIHLSNGKSTKQYLHRFLMKPTNEMVIDHKDGNGLNCSRSNMRIVTKSQNGFNQRPHGRVKKIGVSVHYSRNNKKFRVQFFHEGRRIPVRLFDTEDEAAAAYNELAIKYRGSLARLNKVA